METIQWRGGVSDLRAETLLVSSNRLLHLIDFSTGNTSLPLK